MRSRAALLEWLLRLKSLCSSHHARVYVFENYCIEALVGTSEPS